MCICIQRVNNVYIVWMLCVYYRWRLAPQHTLSSLLFCVSCVRYFEIVAASSAHELILSSNLKRHLSYKHNVDVKWFSCHKCGYKCKHRDILKRNLFQHGKARMPLECPYGALEIAMAESHNAIRMPERCFGHGHGQKARMSLEYSDGALDMAISRKPECH